MYIIGKQEFPPYPPKIGAFQTRPGAATTLSCSRSKRRGGLGYRATTQEKQSLSCESGHRQFEEQASEIGRDGLGRDWFIAHGTPHDDQPRRVRHGTVAATTEAMAAQLVLILTGARTGVPPTHHAGP